MCFQKKILFLFIVISLNVTAQYDVKAYQDSLKKYEYLEEYFKNNKEYTDSSYAIYLSKKAPIDTFEVDSLGGFGFKPTSLIVSYKPSNYLKFYVGLGISENKQGNITSLSFHNYNGLKTCLLWEFHSNGNIYKIISYPQESLDTVKSFGQLATDKNQYYLKQFRKSGKMELSGKYMDGKKEGNWFYYDQEGILFKKEKYTANKRVSRISF